MGSDARPRPSGTRRIANDVLAPGAFGVLLGAVLAWQAHRPLDFVTNAQLVVDLIALTALALGAVHARGTSVAPPRGLAPWLVLFTASAGVSVVGSPEPVAALVRAGLYVALVLVAVLVHGLCRHRRPLPLTGWCLVVAVIHLPFLGHALVDIASSGDESGYSLGVFWNVRHLGTAGLLAAMAATSLVVLDRRWRLPGALLTGVALFGVIASGSRGALLSWLCFVVLLLLLTHRKRIVATDAGTALLAATSSVWVLDWTGTLATPNIFGRLGQGWGEGVNEVSSGRLDVWSTSIEQFLAHPWFGSGPDAYLLTECCVRTVPHAHNIVLQALMEFGLVGCGLLAALVIRVVVRSGGARRLVAASVRTPENTVMTAMVAAILGLSMIDGAFYWTFPLVHLAVFSGLLAAGIGDTGREAAPSDQSSPSENAASRSWLE